MRLIYILFRYFPSLKPPPAAAFFLIPVYGFAAVIAGPFFLLRLNPLFNSMFFDVFQVGFHSPMVRPFIVHEIMKFGARVFFTETAKFNIPLLNAVPEFALKHIFIDIITQAATAVLRCASPAK